MALSEEELRTLQEDNGGVLVVDKIDEGFGAFVFRVPSPTAAKRFRSTINSDKRGIDKDEAWAQLMRDCLTYPKTDEGKPDLSALAKLLDRFPFLPMAAAPELIDAAGGTESHVKKL